MNPTQSHNYADQKAPIMSAKAWLLLAAQAVQRFFQRKAIKMSIRWTAFLGIATYLFFKLSSIGWSNIIEALPTSPGFYVLSLAFVCLPIMAERLAFKMAANTISMPPLKIFIKKHIINKAVMNYTGEGYFLHHVSRLKGMNLGSAAIIIKNLALVRTFAANFWILLLILGAIMFGNSDLLHKITQTSPLLTALIIAISVGTCIGSIIFFGKLTRLKLSVAGKIAFIYVIRSALAAGILILQWNMILPGTPLAVWALFLIVFFIAKKSPIGGDLVFVSAALTLPGLNGGSAEIAAMLLTIAISLQIIYSLGLLFTYDYSWLKPRWALKTATSGVQ